MTATAVLYEEAKRQARDDDPAVRLGLARRTDVRPEILYFLAADPDSAVRREIADNRATPAHADLLLARDDDEAVRLHVAEKIARLAPGLSAEESARLGSVITETLLVLANDKLVQVRRILAEALAETDAVDPAVVERLARDDAEVVSVPVLERSPLLSDEVLIELIHTAPATPRLQAISRRAGLAADVADAIVATDREPAIATLLENASAQIREETLDALIEGGMGRPSWHQPLVARPALSPPSVLKLAEYVARSLLSRLTERRDIDPATAEALADTVRRRVAEDGGEHHGLSPEQRAADLHRQGRLDRRAVVLAVETGDREFAIAALTERAELPGQMVRRIVNLASPAGMVALVWKAGFDMALAEQLQVGLARIEPGAVLRAAEGGGFPQSADEMEWQLELFES